MLMRCVSIHLRKMYKLKLNQKTNKPMINVLSHFHWLIFGFIPGGTFCKTRNENLFVFGVVVVVVVLDPNSQIQGKRLERNLGNSSDSAVQLLLRK